MLRTPKFKTLMLSMSFIALVACSSDGGASDNKTAAPMPPITEMDSAMAQPAPQPLAATDTLTPVMPSASATSTTTSVTTTTAAPGALTVEDRIAKLEQTVGSLRSDYDRIMPAFASLNTTNERIQTLLDEIEKDTGKRPAVSAQAPMLPEAGSETTTMVTTTTTPPPLSAPPIAMKAPASKTIVKTETTKTETVKVETPAAPVAKADAPPTSAAGGAVTGVRIGEHGSKTRLVMDLSGKTKPDFKYDLDNAEKLLLVDLPALAWSGAQAGKGGVSPLVEGWNAQKGSNGGTTVAVQLKRNARILSTQFLPPEGKDPARLVMDIAAGS